MSECVSEIYLFIYCARDTNIHATASRASDLNGNATKCYNSTQYGTWSIPVILKHIHIHMHNETIILFTIVEVLLLCLPFGEFSF